jgi:predicted kinase
VKSLIILRGLPGSGKTALAKLLSEAGKYPVFAIDDYFTDASGNYTFRFEDNFKAYEFCRSRTEEAMKAGDEKIFLDNVFSLEWEMEPYFKLASEYAYQVHVVTVENRHHSENRHGVSTEQIQRMAEKYQVVLF